MIALVFVHGFDGFASKPRPREIRQSRTDGTVTERQFSPSGKADIVQTRNFRSVSYRRLRRLRTLFPAENQDDLATGGRTGSSEEEHRRCPEGESSRLRRSSASPPRR